MISLQPELEALRDRGVIGDALASTLIQRERREPFSLYVEVRLMAWLGVMMLAGGVGIIVKNNYDRIGPLVIALALGVAGGGCYALAEWRRRSGKAGAVDDFLVLLGALLISADVGFVESQFHILDSHWQRHLLLLAVLHAIAAYWFDARAVLTLSISALATWIGVEQSVSGLLFRATAADFALRAFVCAGVILAWREIDRRRRPSRSFERVFEHFAANLAFVGTFALMFDDGTRWTGILLALAFSAAAVRYGFTKRAESFVIYGYLYGAVAFDVLIVQLCGGNAISALLTIVATFGEIAGLFVLHAKFKEAAR